MARGAWIARLPWMVTLRDHRGARHVARLMTFGMGATARRAGLTRREFRRLLGSIGWTPALWLLAAAVVLGLVTLPAYHGLMESSAFADWSKRAGIDIWLARAIAGALVVAVVIPTAYVFIVIPFRVLYVRRFPPSALRMGRCPVCLYSLDAAPVESDGRRVCPECGSAWAVKTEPRGALTTSRPHAR